MTNLLCSLSIFRLWTWSLHVPCWGLFTSDWLLQFSKAGWSIWQQKVCPLPFDSTWNYQIFSPPFTIFGCDRKIDEHTLVSSLATPSTTANCDPWRLRETGLPPSIRVKVMENFSAPAQVSTSTRHQDSTALLAMTKSTMHHFPWTRHLSQSSASFAATSIWYYVA